MPATQATDQEPPNPKEGGRLGRVPPLTLVLGSVISVQFGAAISVTIFDEVGVLGSTLLRLGFAALFLFLLRRPRVSRWSATQIKMALLFGVILAAMNLAFYFAINILPVGIATTIEFLGPISIAAIFSRRLLDGLWVALAAAGVVLIAQPWSGGGDLEMAGVLLALLSAFFWGIYILVAQRAGEIFPDRDGLTVAMMIGMAIVFIPGVISGGSTLVTAHILLIGAVIGLLSSLIPYSFELEALRRMPTNVFGTLMSIEPAVAVFTGFIVLSQKPTLLELFAIALVVIASIGVTRTAPPLPAEAAIEA
ncbi:MAG: EamA family transporter [Actinomycetes bacterium]